MREPIGGGAFRADTTDVERWWKICTTRERLSPTMDPALVKVTEMLHRLSDRLDTLSIELSQQRDYVDNGNMHFEGRMNRSRETANFLRGEQLRS
jgi:hypothetical protein